MHRLLAGQLETSPDAILAVDVFGKVVSYNSNFIELWGIPSEALATREDKVFLDAVFQRLKDPERFIERVRYYYEHPEETCKDELQLVDGRILERHSASVFDDTGKPLGRVWYFRDITPRKRAEARVRELHASHQAILDNIPDLVWLKDNEYRFITVNRAFADSCGRGVNELPGKTDFDIWPAKLAERYRADDQAVMKNCSRKVMEEPLVTPSGEHLWIETIKTVVRNDKGEIAGTAGIARSVTERRELTRILAKKGKSLESALSKHAEKLELANRRLSLEIKSRQEAEREREKLQAQFMQAQKMEAVGLLAGGVAHDFNNLLTAIDGYSKLLLYALPEGDQRREDVREIISAGERAAALTRQLLAFSRRQVWSPVVLDLNPAVESASKMLRRLIGEDIKLEVSKPAEPCPVRADPAQIDQVLMNLAVNARDAMPRGGRLTIGIAFVERQPFWLPGKQDLTIQRLVRLSVIDTGTGMTQEVRERIFEPFFTTKEVGKGTGLGLSTVYGIVNQCGGGIEVESASGLGASFHLYFPVADKVEAVRQAVPAPAAGGHETVLLVEDEEALLGLGRRILEGYGYRVITAANGTEALRLLRKTPGGIDILVTDLVMPGMDGAELARQAVLTKSGLKVLFMSGYDRAPDERLPEGAENLLRKPFSPELLAARVRAALDSVSGKQSDGESCF